MMRTVLQVFLVLATAAIQGSSACVEGSCRPSPDNGISLVCGSGRWQPLPLGTFLCLNGSIVPKSQATASWGHNYSTAPTYSTVPRPSASPLSVAYHSYHGDGSLADGWPSISHWINFEKMFEINANAMEQSCSQWNVPLNTKQETQDLKAAIQSTALSSGIDERYILAIVMQESQGCVRVITTYGSHPNPGLMQSYDGAGSCNANDATHYDLQNVKTPCPSSDIERMIKEGTEGTANGGLGLVQYMRLQGDNDTSMWYRTARGYNGGSSSITSKLEDGCCTKAYSSDIANRLLGWVGPSEFQ